MEHALHSLPPKPGWQRQSDEWLVPTVSVVRFCLHLQQLGFVNPLWGENFSTISHSSVARDVFPKMFLNNPTSQALHALFTILYPVLHWHDPSSTTINSVQSRHFPGPNGFVLLLAYAVPSYFFISLVLGPLNSLLWYVPSSRYIWSSAPIFCFCKNK